MTAKKKTAKAAPPKRRRGNTRPVRLPCPASVSLSPEIEAGIDLAAKYLGHSKSQILRTAATEWLIRNGVMVAPVLPAPIQVA
jgi:hypothetical protein